jgi:hypothetical protein
MGHLRKKHRKLIPFIQHKEATKKRRSGARSGIRTRVLGDPQIYEHHRPLTVPDDRPGYTKRAHVFFVDFVVGFKGCSALSD